MLHRENLWAYQNRSVKHIKDNTHSALFLEMGLGKTVSTLTAINDLLYEELDIDNALVVGPKRVVESVWHAECEKWAHLNHLKVVKVVGSPKKRLAALREKADIYLISRDNIVWLCGLYGGSMLPFDMLVVDELSSFKNPKSKRFKALKLVQPSFKRVVGLTGTPAPNSLIDLWSQVYLLDRGERLGKYISNYRSKYFKPGQSNGVVVYNYRLAEKQNERLIHEQIKDICISMKAEDYLDLPGRIVNEINVPLGEALHKKYVDFEKEQVLDMFGEGQEISAVNAAALANKLLQFANGAIYDTNKEYHVVHDLKIEALKEIIEDSNGKPVLVAWTYRSDLHRLKETFPKLRECKTTKDENDWNAGKIPLMSMHPASGGHGLNLQSGGHIIVWFGQTWSLELEQQFNARLDRQGQTNQVIIHKLIASKTIDVKVIQAQKTKSRKQESLMQAVKALIDTYVNS